MAEYFSHDSNARNDEKCLNLRMTHGAAGYGVYWMLVERLRNQDEFQSVADYKALSFDLREDEELIKSVIEDFGLFEFIENDKGVYFYSESLNRRMQLMKDAREKKAAAGRKGAQKRWQNKTDEKKNETDITKNIAKDSGAIEKNGTAMAPLQKNMAPLNKQDSNANANAMAKNGNKRKEKEIKEKEIKENNNNILKHKFDAADAEADSELAQFYQENLGVLTPFIAEDMQAWTRDLSHELVRYALEITTERGASYSYAKQIMKNWSNKNIKTKQQAQAERLEFKKKTSTRRTKQSEMPEYLKKENQIKKEDVEVIRDNDLIDRLQKIREQQTAKG